MASDRQVTANRLNAQKSTGPKTRAGKSRSRRNAQRHGLTAETIVDGIESPSNYRNFAAKIEADYEPRLAVEQALVARLASLLWRLRRATSIESGLLQNHAINLNDSSARNGVKNDSKFAELKGICNFAPSLEEKTTIDGAQNNCRDGADEISRGALYMVGYAKLDLAQSFLQVSNLNGCVFEKLGRYERSLWRQALQIILFLNSNRQGYEKQFHVRKQRIAAGKKRQFFPAHFFERP